jgi:hypothetical protein
MERVTVVKKKAASRAKASRQLAREKNPPFSEGEPLMRKCPAAHPTSYQYHALFLRPGAGKPGQSLRATLREARHSGLAIALI